MLDGNLTEILLDTAVEHLQRESLYFFSLIYIPPVYN